MARFTLPRDIYHGKGCLEELKNLKGKKAVLVVGGGSMKRQGFLDKAVNYLKEGGMEVELIEGVEPDPSVETVMRGAKVMQDFQPDWIVSMGGGSPIDAAKAMWAFYEYPETKFEDLIVPFGFPELRKKAKFAAIPTTSGTATEVTAFSVITDYAKGIKYPLADFNITPDVAIVDPELVEALPAKQVAYTGMDALTHAIEAYVSTLLPSGFLCRKSKRKRTDALCTVPGRNVLLQCAAWYRSFYGAQNRCSFFHRPYSTWLRKRYLPSLCYSLQCQKSGSCKPLCPDCSQNGINRYL